MSPTPRSRTERRAGKKTRRARCLRSSNTDAETTLWHQLRARRLGGYKFRRQHPLGPYILDFYCHEALLAVELDGGQHEEPARAAYDRSREQWLARQGVRVLRFWDHDTLLDTDAVLESILNALRPHPDPLPEGEGAPSPPCHRHRTDPDS